MRLLVQRGDPYRLTTPGSLAIDTFSECVTLEDMLREIAGEPVEAWKIPKETAIPAGVYELELVDSPAHGPDTLRLKNVPGFKFIDIHSGVSKESTEGCITVGDQLNMHALPPTISGGLVRGVLARLKGKVVPRLKAGERVEIEIRNPPSWGS